MCDGQRTAEQFRAAVSQAKQDSRRSIPELVDRLRPILAFRQELMVHSTPYPGLVDEVNELVGSGFLRYLTPDRLTHFERYLQGRRLRADRWPQQPIKDQERVALIAPYLKVWAAAKPGPVTERLRWLIEEYRISLWAQRLGTAEPVSAKKLKQAAEDCARGEASGAPPPTIAKNAAPPIAIAPAASKTKGKPLKSLNALSGLFKSAGN